MEGIEEPTEMLATRRSRRSTAGNRMEAALAEMAAEDAMKDLDDDKEFFVENDEQDEFGSDFESTDEEAEKVAEVGGETEVADEERRVRKAARSKLERMTAAAHAKHKDTFNPDLQLKDKEGPSKPRTKPKTRGSVKLGDVVDAETGEVVVAKDAPAAQGRKRVSKRKHTVMNTSATVTRLKQNEKKKASIPRKYKTEHKVWSQAELLAQALDTEEGNIREHRDYLKNEAEKRKRARVTRTKVEGPLIRWKSRLEEITVVVPPPPPLPLPTLAPAPAPVPKIAPVPSFTPAITPMSNLSAYRGVYGGYGGTFTPTTYTFTTGANGVTASTASTSSAATFISQSGTRQPFTQFQHYQPPNAATGSPFPMWPPPVSTSQNHQPYYSASPASPLPATPSATAPAASTPPAPSISTGPSIPATVAPMLQSVATPTAVTTEPVAIAPASAIPPPTPAAVISTPITAPTPTSTNEPVLTPTPTQTATISSPAAATTTTTAPAPTSIASAAPEVVTPSTSADDKPKEPETKKEIVTKNYVIHELVQQKSGPKPSWTSTMGAMFGDHVKWDEVKVYSGKNRPLSRPRQTCPITGQQAHYFDPRTGVPYANSRAYKTLTQLIKHEYVWDPSLGCYTDHRPIDQQPPEPSSS
ncbi:YL1 nuclear protein-domain-containing protein [Panaeolus papilionaceus]|nr:YL1 nuclear protein-domain-containing protein [Panaeolus papilionaceus]